MSETLDIERSTADAFLGAYNARTGKQFTIIEHSDSPDLRCRDNNTGELLRVLSTVFSKKLKLA